jgi:hypothetical protein
MKYPIKHIGTLFNPFRSNDRTARFYRRVIAPGAGYPTYDEASRDLADRDRATKFLPGIW